MELDDKNHTLNNNISARKISDAIKKLKNNKSSPIDLISNEILKNGTHFLTKKLMLQGYNESRLKSSFRKFYGRYNDLVCDYKLSLSHMLTDLFHTLC